MTTLRTARTEPHRSSRLRRASASVLLGLALVGATAAPALAATTTYHVLCVFSDKLPESSATEDVGEAAGAAIGCADRGGMAKVYASL